MTSECHYSPTCSLSKTKRTQQRFRENKYKEYERLQNRIQQLNCTQSYQQAEHRLVFVNRLGYRFCSCGRMVTSLCHWKSHKKREKRKRETDKVSCNFNGCSSEKSNAFVNTVDEQHCSIEKEILFEDSPDFNEIEPDNNNNNYLQTLPQRQQLYLSRTIMDETEHTVLLPLKLLLDSSEKPEYEDYITRIPTTDGQERGISFKTTYIPKNSKNVRFWDPKGYPLVMVFRNIFKDKRDQINEQLTKSTKELFETKKASPLKHIARGHGEADGRCYHFGVWRKSMKIPQLTADTINGRNKKIWPHFQKWYSTNQEVFQTVNDIFAEHFPFLFAWYDTLAEKLPEKLFGAFATCVVNVDFPVWRHIDKSDCQHGFCFTLEFGDFTEGNLVLETLNIEVECSPGDLIVFPSHLVYHFVRPYQGWRSSMVFLSHDSLFFPASEK